MMEEQFKQVFLEDVESNKEFFILHDSLHNLNGELVFSILKKYTCKAGCKVCYAKTMWEDGEFVDAEISIEEEARLLKFISLFKAVGTMDDLLLIKRKFPKSYEFYKKHSNMFLLSSMTDNAFLQQYDIIMNELTFRNVYEITFSVSFLNLQNGKLVDKIIDKLNSVLTKYSINQIKVIVNTNDGINDAAFEKITKWAKDSCVTCVVHNDILSNIHDESYDLSKVEGVHQVKNYLVDNENPYIVLNQVLYLQRSDLYLLIEDTIKFDHEPFYSIDRNFTIEGLLYNAIREKVAKYEKYCAEINLRDSRYYDYFKWVTDHVTVNSDFNFVPYVVSRIHFAISKTMINEYDYVHTPAGMIKNGAANVVPIIQISSTPIKKKKTIEILSK